MSSHDAPDCPTRYRMDRQDARRNPQDWPKHFCIDGGSRVSKGDILKVTGHSGGTLRSGDGCGYGDGNGYGNPYQVAA